MTLPFAARADGLENGSIALRGAAAALRQDPPVRDRSRSVAMPDNPFPESSIAEETSP